MTIILPSSLKKPSKEDYLNALSNEHGWPFRLRARIINVYRKLMRPVVQGRLEHPTTPLGLKLVEEDVGSNPTRTSHRRYPKNPKRFKKGDSGKKNYVFGYPLQPIFILRHKGKNRPSRVRKIVFRRKRVTYWMKGNKHNGGQHINWS